MTPTEAVVTGLILLFALLLLVTSLVGLFVLTPGPPYTPETDSVVVTIPHF